MVKNYTREQRLRFANCFFAKLDTLTKAEIEYYENGMNKTGVVMPWSQLFAEVYKNEFDKHETLTPFVTFSEEAINVKDKLWNLVERLDTVCLNIVLLIEISWTIHWILQR